MDILTAMMIVEGLTDVDEDQQLEAWQLLVDSGVVWTLPGKYGRTVMDLIEQGLISQ